MSTPAASALRRAPLALWRVVQGFLTTFFNLFGAPEEIAAKHTLTRKPYALLLSWLRVGEALLRRLLLIEAAAYDIPNVRPLLRVQRMRTRRAFGFDAEHPEAWRVSFRCFRGDAHARSPGFQDDRRSVRACVSPRRFHSAWPIAERAEALLRAFNDPAPYAARLARRLYATPHRARALIAHPANAANLVGRQDFAQTGPPADRALKRFESG